MLTGWYVSRIDPRTPTPLNVAGPFVTREAGEAWIRSARVSKAGLVVREVAR